MDPHTPQVPLDMDSFFHDCGENTLTLTVNRRLAAHLRTGYNRWQKERGRLVWPGAVILPMGAWLVQAWQAGVESAWEAAPEGPPTPLLLDSFQEQVVWEQIVAQSPLGQNLLHPSGAAALAMDGWSLLHQWRLEIPAEDGPGHTAETAAFARWAGAFQARLAANGWESMARLASRMEGWLTATTPAAGGGISSLGFPFQKVVLAGFDDPSPQDAALARGFAQAGCEVEWLPPPACPSAPVVAGYQDTEGELRAAARWARRLLEQTSKGAPAPRIGVVVNGLSGLRARACRIFEDEFTPPAAMETTQKGGGQNPWVNITAAPPLASAPLAASALEWLSMGKGKEVSMETLNRLLTSPFVGGWVREGAARGLLDGWLRRMGQEGWSLTGLARAARPGEWPSRQRRPPPPCPLLADRLDQFARQIREENRETSPPQWALRFTGWLKTLGWPGDRTLSSTEQQTHEKWKELLGQFSGLELVAPMLGLGQALGLLAQLAQKQTFQPQPNPSPLSHPPVQIMGELEAGGFAFDHLWVAGWHQDAWPPPPNPNPFLPGAVQANAGLPHATPERELAFARAVTGRLLAAAPDVVVSYPQWEGDRPLGASPLVAGLPCSPPGRLPAPDETGWMAGLYGQAGPKPWEDPQAPPVESHRVRGGSELFKDQAACPFKAFAHHRLGARPLETVTLGVASADRGMMVHRVLETLWQNWGDQKTLAALSVAQREAQVAQAVETAVEERLDQTFIPLARRFLELEKPALTSLVGEWLAAELSRPPFRVELLEREQTVLLGGVELNMRVDRADRLLEEAGEDGRAGPGRLFLVDYKTGPAAWSGWFGPRPKDPQLPMYCVTSPEPVAGMAFGLVRRGETGLKGLVDLDGKEPLEGMEKVKRLPGTSWGGEPLGVMEDLRRDWEQVLSRLGEAHRGGDARVDPRKVADSCRYCGLEVLCRLDDVDPSARYSREEDPETDEEDQTFEG
ncbi:MAG: PD-(D/E)XK nuclease family protein [Deltaproteobacteria bacterium]|nr:PD-(D/E)XK nuclease family protein [Deltaproteobacteria bacterium]